MEPQKPKPVFNRRVFWDVNFDTLDYDGKASFIIERVFERGDVDDIRQCRTDGEINVPLSQGTLEETDIAGEIGEVIVGKKKGRVSDEEITLFDSTGIALQDSATIPLEYERALAAGVGIEKKMIST